MRTSANGTSGDKVAWTGALGSYAQQLALPAHSAVAVPGGVSDDVAAASMLQGLTSHYLIDSTYPLAERDRCVVHAAAGGVGLLLSQMAKMKGAEVFATVGTDEKAELARSAGADHIIMYREVDFAEAIEGLAGPNAIDVVYDGLARRRSREVCGCCDVHWTKSMAGCWGPEGSGSMRWPSGIIKTGLWEQMQPDIDQYKTMVAARTPLLTDQTAEDIADAVAFLCSKRAMSICPRLSEAATSQ